MPFVTNKRRRFMHWMYPEIAEKWEREAKRKGTDPVTGKKRKKKEK